MSEQKTERLEMRVSEEFLRTVDDWRQKQPGVPPRAEAIRMLVNRGLIVGGIDEAMANLSEVLLRLVHRGRLHEEELLEFVDAVSDLIRAKMSATAQDNKILHELGHLVAARKIGGHGPFPEPDYSQVTIERYSPDGRRFLPYQYADGSYEVALPVKSWARHHPANKLHLFSKFDLVEAILGGCSVRMAPETGGAPSLISPKSITIKMLKAVEDWEEHSNDTPYPRPKKTKLLTGETLKYNPAAPDNFQRIERLLERRQTDTPTPPAASRKALTGKRALDPSNHPKLEAKLTASKRKLDI